MKQGFFRIVAAATAIGLLGWWVAGQLDIRSDLSFVFPERISERTEFLTDRLRDPAAQGTYLLAIEGGDKQERQGLSLSFADALRATGSFERVENGAATSPYAFDFLFKNRYLLGPPWEESEEFSTEAIAASLKESFALLGTSPGQLLKRYLPRDPAGRTADLLAALAPEHRPATEGGVWTSRDGKRSLLLAQVAGEAFDLVRQTRVLAEIRQVFEDLKEDADYRLLVTGPPAFAVATRDRIRGEVRILSAISFALLVTLILAGFRKPSLILLLGLPMGIGVLAGLAAVQAVFGFVHGITLAFGACLVGIAMDYPLHVLAHAAKDRDTARSAQAIWPTLRLGAVTTVAAFVPFMLADFPGLAQIGLFVGAGLAAAVLSTRYLFPLLLPAVDRVPLPDMLLWRLASLAPFVRLPLLLLTLLTCGLLLLKWDTLWETDLAALSPAPQEMVALDRELRSSLGAPDLRYLVAVNGGTVDEVLQREERITPALHRLAGQDRITGWRMLADILPSAGEQQRRTANIPESGILRQRLEQAVSGTPFRKDAFEPFLADMARMRKAPPVTFALALESGAADILRPLLSENGGGATGIVTLSGLSDPKIVEHAVQELAVPGAEFIDLKAETNRLVDSSLRSAGLWLLASLVAVLTLLYLGLRDRKTVLRVIGPVLISMTVTLGTLAALDIPVSMFHILSLILVAGLGMDYGLFFARHGGNRILTFRAVLLCNLTTATVFFVMAFSTIPVLHGIGLTVAVGSFLALVATAAFARSAG